MCWASDSEIVNETKIQGTTDALKAGSLGIDGHSAQKECKMPHTIPGKCQKENPFFFFPKVKQPHLSLTSITRTK